MKMINRFETLSGSQNQRVVLGLSGGIDSAVAGKLLLDRGFEVVAVFMKNWSPLPGEVCTSEEDYLEASAVAKFLGVSLYTVNFVEEYKEEVFNDLIKGLENGVTPNPDILCNKEIKFKYFLKAAKKLGAKFLATGHYAQTFDYDGHFHLGKGKDSNKDQSYFLHAVDPNVWKDVLFPLGGLLKERVKEIAKENNFPNANRKESMGICFIGKNKFSDFISKYIKPKMGKIVSSRGEVVGSHMGHWNYTLGQRKGLGIGASTDSNGSPWFVIGKNVEKNIVYVKQSDFADEIMKTSAICGSWISQISFEKFSENLSAKIRHRQSDQELKEVIKKSEKRVEVKFKKAQRAMTPGQYTVIYSGEICLGGGPIEEVFS